MNKKLLEEEQQDELLFEYEENKTPAMWAGLIFKWAVAIALIVGSCIIFTRLQAYLSVGGTYYVQSAEDQSHLNDSLTLHNMDVVTNFEGRNGWAEGRYWLHDGKITLHVDDKVYEGRINKKDKSIRMNIDGQDEVFKKEARSNGDKEK